MEEFKYIVDTLVFLLSGILVIWMAAGFAMLEAGLTTPKNNSTILLKNLLLMAIACIMYYIIGYSLMYGTGNSLLGAFEYGYGSITQEKHSLGSDFFFQVAFVATSASIISGV